MQRERIGAGPLNAGIGGVEAAKERTCAWIAEQGQWQAEVKGGVHADRRPCAQLGRRGAKAIERGCRRSGEER